MDTITFERIFAAPVPLYHIIYAYKGAVYKDTYSEYADFVDGLKELYRHKSLISSLKIVVYNKIYKVL